MRTIPYADILGGVADLCGLDREDIPVLAFSQIRQHVGNRLKKAWEFHYWPELTVIDQRFFREDYDGLRMYGLGDEVYHPATAAYYQSLIGANLGNLPTDPLSWVLLTDFDKVIEFAQPGKPVIGDAFSAWSRDPRRYYDAVEQDMQMSTDGYHLQHSGSWVWLKYRIPWPILKGNPYDNTVVNVAGSQVYFLGDFYDALVTTLVGDSPAFAPAKWQLVEIPRIFFHYLQFAAYSDWLLTGGQTDRAAVEYSKAEKLLAEQVQLYSGQQGMRQTTTVFTR